MEVLYLTRRKLDLNVAPTMQIIHTVRAMCAAGTDVRFVSPWSRRSVLHKFKLVGDGSVPPQLSITSVGSGPNFPVLGRLWPGTAWTGIRARLRQFLRRIEHSGADVVVFTRDRRIAAQVLADCPLKTVFEYHEPRSVTMVQDDRLPEDHPKVHKIRADEITAVSAADALVTVSQCHADEAHSLYQTDTPVWCIPNGADPSLFAVSAEQRRPQRGRVLYVGSLKPWKGLPLALTALARTAGAELHICGGKEGNKDWHATKRLISELNLDDRVVMHGHLPQQELRGLLQTSTVGILPLDSNYALAERYTSPLKLYEYLMAGLPVVASDLPSVRAVLQQSEAGVTFRPNDAADFAEKLRYVLDSPDVQQRLSDNARRASSQFSWAHRGQRLAEVCHEVIARPQRRQGPQRSQKLAA